jgi:hypothetical protein
MCLCYCLFVDCAFKPVAGVIVHLTVSVVGSSHHGHDAKRNLTPPFLVGFVVP